MKLLLQLAVWLMLLILSSCGSGTSSAEENGSNEEVNVDSAELRPGDYAERGITRYTTPQHGCNVPGKILSENQLWLEAKNTLFVIKADSSTYDEQLGDSHRILEIYNTENCKRIKREVLPINESPDFAYFLAKITYNNASQLVAIRGFNVIYVYDLAAQKMLPPIEPSYSSDRYAVDAQSGRLLRLELWENHILGYAQDFGAFVINLENKSKPKSTLPFAEWEDENGKPHALFLLASQEGGQQAMVPSYQVESATFSINPLFDEPQEINTENAAGIDGSRYVVFRGKGSPNAQGIAIDLKSHKLVDLPQNIATGNNQTILDWLRQNI